MHDSQAVSVKYLPSIKVKLPLCTDRGKAAAASGATAQKDQKALFHFITNKFPAGVLPPHNGKGLILALSAKKPFGMENFF